MKQIILIALLAVIGCTKETSYHANCGKVLQKIHDSREPVGNDIWAITVSVTDSTERWVGLDSARWIKVNVGDRWCD